MVLLGSNPEGPMTTQQIASRTLVPAGYLSKVLQSLGREGLVEAQRGLGGGFSLARPLEEVTVLDVINAVDPLKRIDRCPLGLLEHGLRMCALHRRLDEGIALIESLFGQTTIRQLVADQKRSQPLCDPSAVKSGRASHRRS
jgi:Rrf2 family protein